MIPFIIGLLLGASIGIFAYALVICARERDEKPSPMSCANCKHSYTDEDGTLCQNPNSRKYTIWTSKGDWCQWWEDKRGKLTYYGGRGEE